MWMISVARCPRACTPRSLCVVGSKSSLSIPVSSPSIMIFANSEYFKIPYAVGIAKYSDLAKSMMVGDATGMLKMLFDPATHKLLGVHALGPRATDIIQSG